jgi:alpha-1,3-rhamnosyl/mannosyltransferase
VPSAFTAAAVERQLGVDPRRIVLCPPGAPPWTPREAPPSPGYLLFFGTLEPRKNIGGLLDAYERLIRARPSPPELVLAGRASEDARDWIARIGREPLAGHVRHLGYVDPADRQTLYTGARLLVLPSFEEGFGMPVLEAMTLGVPVVASNRGSLPEVLGDAGELVDPDDTEALAAAMARLLEDDAQAAACAVRGVSRARMFTWSATAKRVFEAYGQAADEAARSQQPKPAPAAPTG